MNEYVRLEVNVEEAASKVETRIEAARSERPVFHGSMGLTVLKMGSRSEKKAREAHHKTPVFFFNSLSPNVRIFRHGERKKNSKAT